VSFPLAVCEHVQTFRAGSQGVCSVLGQMDEEIARSDLEHLSVLPGEPGSSEDEKDLLLGSFGVGRCRPLPRVDADPLQADGDAGGGRAEVVPVSCQVPGLPAARLDAIPVSEMPQSCLARSSASMSTTC